MEKRNLVLLSYGEFAKGKCILTGDILTRMAAAEDKSWEYTLGRIDERTEQIDKRLSGVEQRLDRVEETVSQVRDQMLRTGPFLTVILILAAFLGAMITLVK